MVYFTFMTPSHTNEDHAMSAMEKAAWTEFLVTLFTIAAVSIAYPWLGDGAAGGFGLLAFVTCGLWFIRGKRKQTHVDERDQEIDRQSKLAGMSTTWMFLFLALIAIVFLNSSQEKGTVSLSVLNWLIWIQFAIFFLVHGLVSIIAYRKQRHAS